MNNPLRPEAAPVQAAPSRSDGAVHAANPAPVPVGRPLSLAEQWQALLPVLRSWPWLQTLRTLRERFREDRLGLTASSLTFTTLISLVPLVTVMLAVFSAFPMFAGLEPALRTYFLQNLVPDGIAQPVLEALTEFAGKARGMGTAGLALLLVTALALVLTIDRTLNSIWRVRQQRSFSQRVLVYWATLTLGPVALALSLSLTAWAFSFSGASKVPQLLGLSIDLVEFVLLAGCAAALFHFVPNSPVRWAHAWAGGLFVAVAFEVAKRLLGWYLVTVPSYSKVYGAFATVPILMLWVYLSWLIVLFGAVIAAYAPSLQMRVARRRGTPGWRFELALAVMRELLDARSGAAHGLSMVVLARRLRVEPLQLEDTLALLCELDWVQRLQETRSSSTDEPRYVLLCDPAQTALQPLVQRSLFQPGPASAAFMAAGGLRPMLLAQALGETEPDQAADTPAAAAADGASIRT